MSTEDLQSAIGELRTRFGAIASAVISRDGLLLAKDIPKNVVVETFTIMCATMMGAASTAHSEMRVGQPKMIVVSSEKHKMVILGGGTRKALAVSIVPLGTKMDGLIKNMETLLDMV